MRIALKQKPKNWSFLPILSQEILYPSTSPPPIMAILPLLWGRGYVGFDI